MPHNVLEIEFDSSSAEMSVAAALEHHVRKAIEPLRCPRHFPGRVSFRGEGNEVRLVDACCAPFLEEVRVPVALILAQGRVLRKLRLNARLDSSNGLTGNPLRGTRSP
jgi:hypothetical protein